MQCIKYWLATFSMALDITARFISECPWHIVEHMFSIIGQFHASGSGKYFCYLKLFCQFSNINFIGRNDLWNAFYICITNHLGENHDESGRFRPFLDLYMQPLRPYDLWPLHDTDNMCHGLCLVSEKKKKHMNLFNRTTYWY